MHRKDKVADVSILWISRYDYEKDWVLSEHFHEEFYQLIYCISGSGNAYIDNRKYQLKEKSIILLQPGVKHSIDNIGGLGLKTLDIKFLVNDSNLVHMLKTVSEYSLAVDDTFRDSLEEIRIEGDREDYEYSKYSQYLLGILLIRLARLHLPEKKKTPFLTSFYYTENLSITMIKLMAFIQNNYQQKLKSTDFEKVLNYSYRYLEIMAKKEIGQTPIELVATYRIYLAKEQLAMTDLEIKEISESLGFPNIHHFSRSFKRITGITPGQYRKSQQIGIGKNINFNKKFVNVNNTVKPPVK